ncbi:MAG: hypothetical protein ACT4TC_22380 [Myxococcaceae bacterium]
MTVSFRHALLLSLALASAAQAEDWSIASEKPYLVKTRPLPNSAILEVWAEGVINAPVQDIQETMMDPDRFPKFMPYVKEGRNILTPFPDGSRYVYVRVNPPMLSPRDYVTHVTLVKGVAADGSGEFENKWVATPDIIPSRANIVRLRFNEGGWKVTPRPDGSSYAVYRFAVDPGGAVPAFAANMGNKSGIQDTFKAVEQEAQRRAAERKVKAAQPPPPPVTQKQ